jgi:hypothetical protein
MNMGINPEKFVSRSATEEQDNFDRAQIREAQYIKGPSSNPRENIELWHGVQEAAIGFLGEEQRAIITSILQIHTVSDEKIELVYLDDKGEVQHLLIQPKSFNKMLFDQGVEYDGVIGFRSRIEEKLDQDDAKKLLYRYHLPAGVLKNLYEDAKEGYYDKHPEVTPLKVEE